MNEDLKSAQVADRARRSVREIAVAVVLTVAALAFVVAALNGRVPETAAVVDPSATTPSESN